MLIKVIIIIFEIYAVIYLSIINITKKIAIIYNNSYKLINDFFILNIMIK
jgi:hypothetical protein